MFSAVRSAVEFTFGGRGWGSPQDYRIDRRDPDLFVNRACARIAAESKRRPAFHRVSLAAAARNTGSRRTIFVDARRALMLSTWKILVN